MKYVFISGVPGSCWGWPQTYAKLASPLVDNTNNQPWRINNNRPCAATHETSVFAGPYNEIGEGFDQLSLYDSKEQIFAEIDKAFEPTDKHFVRFVQCHWFAYQLDWIAENLPEVDILMSLRNQEMSYQAWHDSGGWDIQYPSYKWYNNSQNMWRQGVIEHKLMKKFVRENNVKVIAGWHEDWFDWHWPEFAPHIDKTQFPGPISAAKGGNGMTGIVTGWDSLCWGLYKGKESTPIVLNKKK
jgi:hypothetical protein